MVMSVPWKGKRHVNLHRKMEVVFGKPIPSTLESNNIFIRKGVVTCTTKLPLPIP